MGCNTLGDLKKATQNQVAEIKSQLNSADTSIVPFDDEEGIPLQEMGPGRNLTATEEGAPESDNAEAVDKEALKAQLKQVQANHETEMEKLRAANGTHTSRAQAIYSSAQILQLGAQGAQANAGIQQMQGQVQQSVYSAQTQAAQTAQGALSQVLQFDPYAANVASSRA